MSIKLNEQITFLRKSRGITQDELAKEFGISNQAVSKWESGQSCPDIQLLPQLAEYFAVSIDELMGYKPADTSQDILLLLRNMIQELPTPEDAQLALKIACTLHAILFSKEMTAPGAGNPGWDTEDAVLHASEGEWGLSGIHLPEITTQMRMASVFFSANKNLQLNNPHIHFICSVLQSLGNANSLKTFLGIYQLTIASEETYAGIPQIVAECELSETTVNACIQKDLHEYLLKKQEKESLYRIKGQYLHVIPLLAMLCNIG